MIQEFIQNELLSRLKKAGVLVVYDTDHRYRELCLRLAEESRVVIVTAQVNRFAGLARLSGSDSKVRFHYQD